VQDGFFGIALQHCQAVAFQQSLEALNDSSVGLQPEVISDTWIKAIATGCMEQYAREFAKFQKLSVTGGRQLCSDIGAPPVAVVADCCGCRLLWLPIAVVADCCGCRLLPPFTVVPVSG